nr:PepSY-associated TM helix domain-containing protein [Novosphingobium panipatense]
MKLPTDLVRMYKEIHGWVGIISGLALFVAFYAGAVTMFETPLQRWASPPPALASAPSLQRTPELVAKALAAHPEAAKGYEIHLKIDSANPARMSWTSARGEEAEHGGGVKHYASLAPDGTLQVATGGPSEVAQFIDVLHQQVGLPFPHEIAMPIMGAIALLYTIALVSGLVVLLPSLVSDLFALRIGKNVKRMWLDVHNVLGLFSLPFHIIMALTAVVFAFHDQFYGAQGMVFGGQERAGRAAMSAAAPPRQSLSPVQLVQRVKAQAPGFTPEVLVYGQGRGGLPSLRVQGSDARHGMRAPTYGMAGIDPETGAITATDYMPGMQDGWSATITSFFALHFGNFGGNAIRWSYFLLGLAGAFLFYTGNLLWVESRRKKERKAGAVEQTRATKILGALTVGVPLGCIAGISLTLAAAKLLGASASYGLHSAIYYAVFLGATAWALSRGAARSGAELTLFAALSMLAIPVSSLLAGSRWFDTASLVLVDTAALALAAMLFLAARTAKKRARQGPRDSVWSHREEGPQPV